MASQFLVSGLKRLGYIFYVADPDEMFIDSMDKKPHFTVDAVPAFIFLMVVESVINAMERKLENRVQCNDAFTSVAQGMLMEMSRILTGGVDILIYIYVFEHYRITSMPWDSIVTWIVVFIAVDFTYYWFHRAAHEINLLWAGHQVHHSSEYYNLTTALRQSVIQDHIGFVFYLPMALFVSPHIYAVHRELNLLFQFWIHTQSIRKLGPIEWIFNTPSHHRVHHGVNRYCIDKNYAGVLIIWDRIFGTFVSEGDEVAYGVTHPIKTFDPFKVQFDYVRYLVRRFKRQKTWKNSFSVLFKGPGWTPGKPRLGNPQDLPDVHAPLTVYNPPVASWVNWYCSVHFMLLLVDYMAVASSKELQGSMASVILLVAYVTFGLYNLALLFESKSWARKCEIARCTIYLITCFTILPLEGRFEQDTASALRYLLIPIHVVSLLWFIMMPTNSMSVNQDSSKTK